MTLTEADLDKPNKVLSSGQQTRLALLRAFISNKPLILLDEPTNHLDQEMIDQLINHIQQSKRTIIYVSHHRGFIDQTASHVIEITPKQLKQKKKKQIIKHKQKSKRTIIYVSHHRGFIDQNANHVIEITPENTRKFNGN